MRHARTLMLSMLLATVATPVLAQAQAVDASPAPASLTKAQVEQQLQAKGYTDVHDLKFDDGLWEAKATSADGKHVGLKIDPKNAQILPDKTVSQVGKDDIRASLSTAGYTGVHDIDFEDGVWKAKAKNANGEKLKVQLSPKDASIIATEAD